MSLTVRELTDLICKVTNVCYSYGDFNSVEALLYNYYIDAEMFAENEIKLVTNIKGWNVETFNDMLFARYGYRDLEQMLNEK